MKLITIKQNKIKFQCLYIDTRLCIKGVFFLVLLDFLFIEKKNVCLYHRKILCDISFYHRFTCEA